MINKKLVSYLKEDKKYVYLQVLMQWLALLSQIIIVAIMANMINELFIDQKINNLAIQVIIIIILIFVKGYFGRQATMYSFKAAKNIKGKLRVAVYKKILALNNHYSEVLSMASLTQLMSEGVEQLETYFGKYLPQFFYSMLAPITLFIVLCQVDFKAALVLFICVPLIPLSIVLVQKFAKRLLSKYWGLYGNLAERFLDNVGGLTTLKGYCGDASKHQEMNEEAQRFRSITMKVLVMQLNSISIMDLVAYGGAALGIIFSLLSYYDNKIDLSSLNEEEQADVLETAYQYVQYKYVDGDLELADYRKKSLKLLMARSKIVNQRQYFDELKEGENPVEAHKAKQVGAIFGYRNGEGFQEIGFKPVYTSLLDDSYGLLKGAEINLLEGKIRHYDSRNKWEISEFNLLSIKSLAGADAMFAPLSYDIKFGYRELFDAKTGDDRGAVMLETGVGQSYALTKNTLLYAMSVPNVAYGGDLHDNGYLGIGFKGGVYYNFDKIRLNLNAMQNFTTSDAARGQTYQAEGAYGLINARCDALCRI